MLISDTFATLSKCYAAVLYQIINLFKKVAVQINCAESSSTFNWFKMILNWISFQLKNANNQNQCKRKILINCSIKLNKNHFLTDHTNSELGFFGFTNSEIRLYLALTLFVSLSRYVSVSLSDYRPLSVFFFHSPFLYNASILPLNLSLRLHCQNTE